MSRVKQFIKCLFATINEEDKDFINKYLDEEEKLLLYKLPIYDIKHSINVARDIYINESKSNLSKINHNNNEIIKSAILHDIGKSYNPLNPIDKSILVLLNSVTKGKIIKYMEKSPKIYIFFNHGEEGYKMLTGKKYSDEFLYTIRNHHNYMKKSKWLDTLRMYDDRN